MNTGEKLRLVSAALSTLLIAGFICATAVSQSVAAKVPGQDLAEQVNQLVQECQNGEKMTVVQLREVAERCDVLSETIKESDHPQKKLLVIRLNKSRNLCTYLLQLQQR